MTQKCQVRVVLCTCSFENLWYTYSMFIIDVQSCYDVLLLKWMCRIYQQKFQFCTHTHLPMDFGNQKLEMLQTNRIHVQIFLFNENLCSKLTPYFYIIIYKSLIPRTIGEKTEVRKHQESNIQMHSNQL